MSVLWVGGVGATVPKAGRKMRFRWINTTVWPTWQENDTRALDDMTLLHINSFYEKDTDALKEMTTSYLWWIDTFVNTQEGVKHSIKTHKKYSSPKYAII